MVIRNRNGEGVLEKVTQYAVRSHGWPGVLDHLAVVMEVDFGAAWGGERMDSVYHILDNKHPVIYYLESLLY